MPKGRVRKIIPLFIGPFRILKVLNASLTYTLELPRDLESRGLYPTFHASLLRCYEPNDNVLFPHYDTQAFYDLRDSKDDEWLVDEILFHRWSGNKVEFHVKWNLGDTTWEPYKNCKDLAVLNDYLDLIGVKH